MQPEFHFRSVIGKLNFLEKSTRPDISISVHQCARFSDAPKKRHAKAVKRIERYMLATRDKGIIIHPKKSRQFACWVDADFAGNWRQADAHSDSMTAKSHSGWIVCFAGVPITWASKMQTITAMSTTEAEYIALSTSLREVIPLMGLLTEARAHGMSIDDLPPKIHCTIFEDNSGALELARLPKIRPIITAPSTTTLIQGLFMLPTYHMKDRKQAQTLNGMWHPFKIDWSHSQTLRPQNDRNQSAKDIYDYACNP